MRKLIAMVAVGSFAALGTPAMAYNWAEGPIPTTTHTHYCNCGHPSGTTSCTGSSGGTTSTTTGGTTGTTSTTTGGTTGTTSTTTGGTTGTTSTTTGGTPVPEPGMLGIMGMGLIGLGLARRRKNRA